jgi:hypothetical protein
MYEPTAEEIVRRIAHWEAAATRSPNAKVASSAPLPAPSEEEAATMLPRLHELRAKVERDGVDQHGRAMPNLDAAAMGWLREEWRADRLGPANGYQDVWQGPDDPLYDGTSRNPR